MKFATTFFSCTNVRVALWTKREKSIIKPAENLRLWVWLVITAVLMFFTRNRHAAQDGCRQTIRKKWALRSGGKKISNWNKRKKNQAWTIIWLGGNLPNPSWGTTLMRVPKNNLSCEASSAFCASSGLRERGVECFVRHSKSDLLAPRKNDVRRFVLFIQAATNHLLFETDNGVSSITAAHDIHRGDFAIFLVFVEQAIPQTRICKKISKWNWTWRKQAVILNATQWTDDTRTTRSDRQTTNEDAKVRPFALLRILIHFVVVGYGDSAADSRLLSLLGHTRSSWFHRTTAIPTFTWAANRKRHISQPFHHRRNCSFEEISIEPKRSCWTELKTSALLFMQLLNLVCATNS